MSYNLLPTSSLWQLKLSRKFEGKLTSMGTVICHLYGNLCRSLPGHRDLRYLNAKLNPTNYFRVKVKFEETRERRQDAAGQSAVKSF